MKKKIAVLSVTVIAATLVPLAWRAYGKNTKVYRTLFAAQASGSIPFQGVEAYQEEFVNCNPKVVQQSRPYTTRRVALAGDGSTSTTITFLHDGSSQTTIHRVDGLKALVFPHLKAKMTFFSQARFSEVTGTMRDPRKDCLYTLSGEKVQANQQKVGEENLLGYRTIKAVDESANRKETNWYAPDLGCYAMQRLNEFATSDPGVKSATLIRTVSLRPGMPSKAAFEPADDLVEVSPSQIARLKRIHLFKASGMSEADATSRAEAAASPADRQRESEDDKKYFEAKMRQKQ